MDEATNDHHHLMLPAMSHFFNHFPIAHHFIIAAFGARLFHPVGFTTLRHSRGTRRCAARRRLDAWKSLDGAQVCSFRDSVQLRYIYIIIYIQVVYGRYIEVVYMYLAELTLVHGRYNLYFELLHRLYKP